MSENELFCVGCGAQLQSQDSKLAGFVPASRLQQTQETDLYCQRCFRLRHYNEVAEVPLDNAAFQDLLTSIGHQDALVVYVMDIFNFSGSVIANLRKFIQHNPVLVVGNKIDLIPSSYHVNKLQNWLQNQVKQIGLKPVATQLVSAKKLAGIDELMTKIENLRHGLDVYVVGSTNVGKSTLINAILQANSDLKDLITTSNYPGTTLNEIRIPLAGGGDLVDTPGIIHAGQIANLLTPQELKYVAPQTQLHPRIFQLNAQQTLFLAGLGRLDFVEGEAGSFVAYVDNHLYIHRTKLSNADQFYAAHRSDLLTPPQKQTDFPDLVAHDITTTVKSDIVFSGLGWVTVPKQVRLKAYLPAGIKLDVRPALIN
ncbi:ribosome biogenesis GTPase YqeH [Bombilactobacillus folatiphilus]|uniref:Ribosome biogenesis GTPase YqeH n=1 Tax=Bombilactobacillus folatiphilus TaxID=2923362 RepID=A0ABY4PB92_9LACO|nr:ribosome biogenesis GTPase YqeH [Bombilactobacillus folatiphilus]UQS82542.1 ribosome biogenesis GTPase YqeH [Bombilactobacillus folatiphilus]